MCKNIYLMKREMKASRILIDKVKEFEGLRLRAYRDSGGKPTIGYGHTLGVKMGQRITEKQAEELLEQDLWVAGRFPNTMKELDTQGRYDAVVDFIFNLRVGSFKRSTLYRHIIHHAPDKIVQAEFRNVFHIHFNHHAEAYMNTTNSICSCLKYIEFICS